MHDHRHGMGCFGPEVDGGTVEIGVARRRLGRQLGAEAAGEIDASPS